MVEVAAFGLRNSGSLRTIDITDPTAPAVLDSFTASTGGTGHIGSITWWGDLIVCVNEGDDSLWVIDATDPTDLVEAGRYRNFGTVIKSPMAVRMLGDYAVVTDTSDDGYLYVFDLSDPTTPALAATHSFTSDADGFKSPYGLSIAGTTAVIGAFSGPNILSMDLTDPTSPVRGSFVNDITAGGAGNVHTIARVDEATVAVGMFSGTNSGVWLVDVASMTANGSVTEASFAEEADWPERIAVSGDGERLAISNSNFDVVAIFDISNQASPTLVGSYDNAATLDIPYGIAFTNDASHVCVAGLGTGNFAVLDAGATPDVVGNITGFTAYTPFEVAVKPAAAVVPLLGSTTGYIGPGAFMG